VTTDAKQRKYLVLECIVLALGVFFIFKVQFANAALYGSDGYLHIRMAEFIKQYGIHYTFHWTRFSVFFDRFSDKDFLFHVFLIPFTFFRDIFFGAKLAAATFYTSLFAVMYVFLRKWTKREYVFLFLILFFAPCRFITTLERLRPFALVMIITILTVHFLIKKKALPLFVLALIYSMAHVSAPYMIAYALIVELVRAVSFKEVSSKNLLAVTTGIVVGHLINPYFPNNILYFYLNAILVPFYAAKTGVLELPAEFFPLLSNVFLQSYPLITLGMLGALFLMLIKNDVKTSFHTSVLFAVTAFYYILSFTSQRGLTHTWPFFLLFLASFAKDFFTGERRKIAPVFFTACFASILVFSFGQYRDFLPGIRGAEIMNRHFERMADEIKKHVPEGELVFHANWSDGQYFIGLNPSNDYFVTLDPVYMYYRDKNRYALYRDVAFGRSTDPYRAMNDVFGSRYGYAGKSYFSGLIRQVRRDPRFEVLAEDQFGVLFRLK